MFNALKDQALEIDSKIGTLRKQCTTFAVGYVEEDASKAQSVREKLTFAGREVRHSTADCDRLVEQTQALFTLLTEADKVADEIYDSVIKLYHAQGVRVPPIEVDKIEVGFPIHLLSVPEPSSVARSEEETNFSADEDCDESELPSEERVPEVYLSRTLGEETLGPETPMIRSRKRLF